MSVAETFSLLLSSLLLIFGIGGLLLVIVRLLLPPRPLLQTEIEWPHVITQLPLYNEPEVVDRLLRAVAKMDYPPQRHHIQVLDDSTDETCERVDAIAAELRASGVMLEVIRRTDRSGFKAGALAAGLLQTKADYVAIFDADFVPPADFLTRLLPSLTQQSDAAFIQARWGHLNADQSLLTRAQAANIDAHFYVQQAARSRVDWLMNFNGSAGIWRMAAIQDAGGWQGDTLTEDLDLSHRAALRGWRAMYANDVVVPAELPLHWSAYRQQQFRWAMGTTQTLCKLISPLWRSPLSLLKKLIGTLHLGQYLVQPLLVLHCLTCPWLPSLPWWPAPVLMTAALLTAALPVLHGIGSASALASMILMGTGMAWSGSVAVVQALCGVQRPFARTPKGGRAVGADFPWVEALLALYATTMIAWHGSHLLHTMLMHAVGNAFVCHAWWKERRGYGQHH